MSSAPQVAVVGGGYAGFAAAVTLARGGARVSLFESSRTLGGRARVVDTLDYCLDNGQHILLGAYAETLRMLRLVGVKPGVLETRRGAILIRNETALAARSCLCNEAVKAHFEEVLRGVYPSEEAAN